MSHAKTPNRRPHARRGPALHTSPEQARQLTTLKAKRASRISRESAAAQRRLVTAGASVGFVLLFVVLAAVTSFSWLLVALPTLFMAGTLVASRQAGIRNERDGAAEIAALRQLEAEIRGESPVVAEAAVESVEVTAALVDEAAEAVVEVSEAVVDEAAEGDSVKAESDSPAEDRGWAVASFPVPSYVRKERVKGRQVHADTDLVPIMKMAKAPGRPMAATRPDEASPAVVAPVAVEPTASATFDLESVLEARRAAQ